MAAPTPPSLVSVSLLVNLAVAVTTALGTGVLAWVTTRKSLFSALKAEAETWQGLAHAKDGQLEEVGRRLGRLEDELQVLRKQNAELQTLNLTLQRENLELRTRIEQLQLKVTHLELMLPPGR
jgi:hypothetical protein